MINYILCLDIGIGSVGWAVINIDKRRIEDFGVRIFDSGELKNGKDRKSQQRRGNRAQRRLIRRKSHRKNRLKNYLEKIGLVSVVRVNDYFETKTNNVIELRYKALTEKLSPEEIAACLIHICNNRGYKKFYDIPDDETELDEKELKEEMDSLEHFDSMMKKGGYRTPAEMILKDKAFDEPNSVFRKFHNSDSSEKMLLISREMVRDEVKLILDNQKKYYKCLDDKKISIIMLSVILKQVLVKKAIQAENLLAILILLVNVVFTKIKTVVPDLQLLPIFIHWLMFCLSISS